MSGRAARRAKQRKLLHRAASKPDYHMVVRIVKTILERLRAEKNPVPTILFSQTKVVH